MIKERLEQRASELFEEYYAQYRAAGGNLSEDRFHDTLMSAWNLGRSAAIEAKTTWNNNWGERPGNWEYQEAVQACLDFDEIMEMEDEDDEV